MRASVTTNDRHKRKGASDVDHQPLEIDQSPQPERTQGKSTTGAADLQEKMKAAAKEFAEMYEKFENSVFDIAPATAKAYEQHAVTIWGNHIYCTPVSVMFKFRGEWIQLTPVNVAEACKEIAEAQEARPESYAKLALRDVRFYAKLAERIGWVLPRLEKEVIA
jgi:hypothetical protein